MGPDREREDAKKNEELALIEREIARLSGELDAARGSLASLIKSLQARGIDTSGLEASAGGSVTDVASLNASVNEVSSKASAAGGRELQDDLVKALGAFASPVFQMASKRDENSTFLG
jgi:hypothetical protein